jgi:DNA-binding LacI/PurR family transcriptional regulator
MSTAQTTDLFAGFDAEMWFARRLEEHGYHVFLGATTREQRRDRIRQAIIDRGCDCVIVGKRPGTGKPETYEQAFQRFYGEQLRPKLKGENP